MRPVDLSRCSQAVLTINCGQFKKPDNVGFDFVGVLKIFDFGLARTLPLRDDERTADGLYKMTGCTGSVRYMSPENALNMPYDLTTDVYSWAMIMWFVLALEPPFAMYTEKMILERVTERGYRPIIFTSWSPRLSRVISRSWSSEIKNRPSFAEIAKELREELVEVDPVQASILESNREEQGLPGIKESSVELHHQA
jgi:serine/threonine protein kinase